VSVVAYSNPKRLAEGVEKRGAAMVYLTPGLHDDVGAIGRALEQHDVLTISAASGDVPRGAVLGFELVSAKPKLLVNLPQAKLQNVSFKPALLKLARVIR